MRSRVFAEARHAKKYVRQFNARSDLQAIGETVPISLREAIIEFQLAKSDLSQQTLNDYVSILARLKRSTGEIDTCDVTAEHVDAFCNQWSSVSRTRLKGMLRALSVFFNWATGRNYIASNPVKSAQTKPKSKERDRPIVTEQILADIYNELQTEDERIAYQIAVTTGFDRQVIVKLSRNNIDADNRAFILRRPKTQKVVTVPIHADLWSSLKPILARTSPGGRLLRGLSRRRVVDELGYRDWWKRAASLAGHPEIWFRDLRAVFVSRSQRDGHLPLTDVQRLVGHRSPETTARHYHIPSLDIRTQLDSVPIPGLPRTSEQSID